MEWNISKLHHKFFYKKYMQDIHEYIRHFEEFVLEFLGKRAILFNTPYQ